LLGRLWIGDSSKIQCIQRFRSSRSKSTLALRMHFSDKGVEKRHLVRIANRRRRMREILRLIFYKTEVFLMALSKTEERIELSDGPQPIRGNRGASILGPRNVPLERENPDLLMSPSTDSGTIPNLKFSFAAARNRITPGGWGREVTARELPVATTMAGGDSRLHPGGLPELLSNRDADCPSILACLALLPSLAAYA